ncbi:DMT family transporter, partial [Candidatus Halocynthiibacter alkanivorans]|uniref:DMT family transporter n=1 Tax=Candidatus Halocynthiibacter alkanivorans TaxID=2267619 RepID=UPI0013595B87
PGFLVRFGNLFCKRGSGRAGLVGAGLGFGGVALLIGPGLTQGAGQEALFGYVLALSGAMLWALYSNLRRLDRQDAIVSLTLICGVSAVLSAGVELAGGSGFPTLDAGQWGIILLLAVGPAGGAFFLWDKGMKAGNAPLLSVLGYGAPVISSALMVGFGYAELSLMIFVSTGLIAAGGLVTGLRTAALPVRAVQPCPGSPGRPDQTPD